MVFCDYKKGARSNLPRLKIMSDSGIFTVKPFTKSEECNRGYLAQDHHHWAAVGL
jgi:hypothetical protein